MNEMLNSCTNCGCISSKGLWKMRYQKKMFIQPMFVLVKEAERFCNDEEVTFDLDAIDIEDVKKHFSIDSDDEASEIIITGEPACPKCKADTYFVYSKEIDGEITEDRLYE